MIERSFRFRTDRYHFRTEDYKIIYKGLFPAYRAVYPEKSADADQPGSGRL